MKCVSLGISSEKNSLSVEAIWNQKWQVTFLQKIATTV